MTTEQIITNIDQRIHQLLADEHALVTAKQALTGQTIQQMFTTATTPVEHKKLWQPTT